MAIACALSRARSKSPSAANFVRSSKPRPWVFRSPEAVERLTNQIPIAETNFFSIVINIQQKAGGNLSEALSNLSGVLRDRKMMEGKIKAFSSEAKASAMIIGSLPFAVAGLVYITSPAYISLLWTSSTGQLVLGAAATLDGDRHFRHEEDGEFRLLTARNFCLADRHG